MKEATKVSGIILEEYFSLRKPDSFVYICTASTGMELGMSSPLITPMFACKNKWLIQIHFKARALITIHFGHLYEN